MISYDEALTGLLRFQPTFGTESVALSAAVGRTLRTAVRAKVPSPPFTNSAMDGVALRLADIPADGCMKLSGVVLAGANPTLPAYQPGCLIKIMTGAMLPDWADTVIPVEHTSPESDGRIRINNKPTLGANIRKQGEDLPEGVTALPVGLTLTPEHIMIAAALGHAQLEVQARPRLVIVCTGDELVEPGSDLPAGAVYNSNKYFLIAAAQTMGLSAQTLVLGDDADLAQRELTRILDAAEPTLVLTTGAVSAGEADFLPALASRLGFIQQFHKVAIRPAKPIYFATRDQAFWLGLPGNPISTATAWHVFVKPLLAQWLNLPLPAKVQVTLANDVYKPQALRCFWRAEIQGGRAWVGHQQGSASFAPSINTKAYVELPEGAARIPAETRVSAILL